MLSGKTCCTIDAALSWSPRRLKAAIQEAAGIPVHEQVLVVGVRELDDDDDSLWCKTCGTPPGETLRVSLIRRDAELCSRLRRIEDAALHDLRSAGRADVQSILLGDDDTTTALALVRRDAQLLSLLPEALRADRSVVMAAIRRFPNALEWAAPSLRCDREVVLAATHRDPHALRYAGMALRSDHDFVATAMQGDHPIERLLDNPKEALLRARSVLSFAAESLQQDTDLLVVAGLRCASEARGRAADGRRPGSSPQRAVRRHPALERRSRSRSRSPPLASVVSRRRDVAALTSRQGEEATARGGRDAQRASGAGARGC